MDILFDQQYMVLGDEVPIKLKFKDVIFVMEDVDAASKVVHRRDGKVTSAVTHTTQIDRCRTEHAAGSCERTVYVYLVPRLLSSTSGSAVSRSARP